MLREETSSDGEDPFPHPRGDSRSGDVTVGTVDETAPLPEETTAMITVLANSWQPQSRLLSTRHPRRRVGWKATL